MNFLTHFLDLVFALGLYSCTSSSSPFCLLYQSNKVRRMEGRQYSAKELMVLISCGSQTYSTVNIPEGEITIGASCVYANANLNPKI